MFEWLKVLFIFRATYHPWHTTGGEDWTPLELRRFNAAKHLKFCRFLGHGHFDLEMVQMFVSTDLKRKILEAEFHIEVVPINCGGQFHCPPLKYPAHLSNLCPATFFVVATFAGVCFTNKFSQPFPKVIIYILYTLEVYWYRGN